MLFQFKIAKGGFINSLEGLGVYQKGITSLAAKMLSLPVASSVVEDGAVWVP